MGFIEYEIPKQEEVLDKNINLIDRQFMSWLKLLFLIGHPNDLSECPHIEIMNGFAQLLNMLLSFN